MGMYSWFNEQEIEVINKKKLQEIKENKEFELYDLISDDLEVDFDNWSEQKLYNYWYDEKVLILKELATCIKGYVEFAYEEGFPFRIYFEDGKAYLKCAEEINWDKCEKQFFD